MQTIDKSHSQQSSSANRHIQSFVQAFRCKQFSRASAFNRPIIRLHVRVVPLQAMVFTHANKLRSADYTKNMIWLFAVRLRSALLNILNKIKKFLLFRKYVSIVTTVKRLLSQPSFYLIELVSDRFLTETQ